MLKLFHDMMDMISNLVDNISDKTTDLLNSPVFLEFDKVIVFNMIYLHYLISAIGKWIFNFGMSTIHYRIKITYMKKEVYIKDVIIPKIVL